MKKARRVLLDSLTDGDAILYRQKVLKDCIGNRSAAEKIYCIAASAMEDVMDHRQYAQPNFSKVVSMSVKVMNSVRLLELLVDKLEELSISLHALRRNLDSQGMIRFCGRLETFLTDRFFSSARLRLGELKSISGNGRIVIGSGIGTGLKGSDHILRKIVQNSPKSNPASKFDPASKSKSSCSNVILLDNIRLANSAREIEDAGLVHILRLVNHFNNNIASFFEALRYEIGFYIGCANLYAELMKLKAPVSFPHPEGAGERNQVFEELYDLSLALCEKKKPVGNDLSAADKKLFVITGAN